MYYATFGDNGNISGFYAADHPAIPDDAVELMDEQWQTYSAEPHMYVRNEEDGEPARRKTDQERADEIAARPVDPLSLDARLKATEELLLTMMLGG